jgi:hypothetical protein
VLNEASLLPESLSENITHPTPPTVMQSYEKHERRYSPTDVPIDVMEPLAADDLGTSAALVTGGGLVTGAGLITGTDLDTGIEMDNGIELDTGGGLVI